MAKVSWVHIPKGCHFSLSNIPFGIITHGWEQSLRPAVAIGDQALDLKIFTEQNGFRDLSIIQLHQAVFSESRLNAFAALGQPIHSVVRKYLQDVLSDQTTYPEVLKNNSALKRQCLIPLKDVKMHLPMKIGDYTDFYAGMNHAHNCGVLFRDPANALQPNYKHLPVGYHGRASSVVVSGTPIRRPSGQILENPTSDMPMFSPCKRLDYELELGGFICKANQMGDPVKIIEAHQFLFGLVLMNDWSARDIQAWEMVPLGPFNAKNFGTSISPWIVLADALEPFRTKGLDSGGVIPLAYLGEPRKDKVYDIKLEVDLKTSSGSITALTRTSANNLLYSFPQFIAHHTVGGCPLAVGDLMGSGTISGMEPGSFGSMLEQNKGGKESVQLQDESERTFIEDGDTIIFRGCCGSDESALVGFGQCEGTILPAHT